MIAICSRFCSAGGGGGGLLIVPLCIMGSFYTGNGPFSSVGELMGCV